MAVGRHDACRCISRPWRPSARGCCCCSAASAIVLIVACVNVANLMLARGMARQRELALRAALGANAARLLQQVIVERLVLSAIGAPLGLLFARWATPLLVRLAPAGTPRLAEVATDVTVGDVRDGCGRRVRRWW